MGIKKNQIVSLKQWEDIIHTVDIINGQYVHKTSGLIISPREYLAYMYLELEVKEIDTYGDVWTKKCGVFHQDWLDIV